MFLFVQMKQMSLLGNRFGKATGEMVDDAEVNRNHQTPNLGGLNTSKCLNIETRFPDAFTPSSSLKSGASLNRFPRPLIEDLAIVSLSVGLIFNNFRRSLLARKRGFKFEVQRLT
jgi:hypothetical protein